MPTILFIRLNYVSCLNLRLDHTIIWTLIYCLCLGIPAISITRFRITVWQCNGGRLNILSLLIRILQLSERLDSSGDGGERGASSGWCARFDSVIAFNFVMCRLSTAWRPTSRYDHCPPIAPNESNGGLLTIHRRLLLQMRRNRCEVERARENKRKPHLLIAILLVSCSLRLDRELRRYDDNTFINN